MWWLAWIFGIVGIVANVLIFQQKNRERLLAVKLIADCAWTTHYCFLMAWSGAAVCALGAVREMVFRRIDPKSRMGKFWLVFFLACSLAIALLTWQSVFSIFPACGSALAVISFWIGKPRLARLFQIVISGAFLTYNVVYASYAGVISELITLSSIFITLIVYKVRSKSLAEAE